MATHSFILMIMSCFFHCTILVAKVDSIPIFPTLSSLYSMWYSSFIYLFLVSFLKSVINASLLVTISYIIQSKSMNSFRSQPSSISKLSSDKLQAADRSCYNAVTFKILTLITTARSTSRWSSAPWEYSWNLYSSAKYVSLIIIIAALQWDVLPSWLAVWHQWDIPAN